ncbi:hypothetical protein PML95_00045 [Vagococcus lutrae]|uniref:Gram-positive cocci surface proteins LPxTG domain-containing protein n=1 Tax=Vagococcus lutrae TaxID=81947 RepID=A0AAE9XNQ5_9ENTE|nr:hypothetical protein [Vagococcus lutrae]WCG22694.1 hypothetical protein PML95_00045 [Vagococcus lutrae]
MKRSRLISLFLSCVLCMCFPFVVQATYESHGSIGFYGEYEPELEGDGLQILSPPVVKEDVPLSAGKQDKRHHATVITKIPQLGDQSSIGFVVTGLVFIVSGCILMRKYQ